jgi:VanZ family protein
VATSAFVIASAPFAGQLRAALQAILPGAFSTIVGTAVGVAVGLGLVIAVARIQDRRRIRYAALAAAVIVAVFHAWLFRTGIPAVDSVERVHFVEYGLITFLFYKAWRRVGDPSVVVMPVLAGVVVGTVEEWLQWFLPNRIGEARDVLLNLAAILSGLLFSLGLDPPGSFSSRLRPGSATRIGVASGAALVIHAAFVAAVHLGYVVRVEGVGTFKSRYSADRLEALARDRRARWRTDPPLVLRRLSAEDQYMDEALWHVRRRNEAWAEGDYLTARQENRILETYFAPVLDTPSYVSPTGHRWPAEQRADADRRTGHAGEGYVSDAEPYPVLIWPKRVFWTWVSSAAVLLIVTATAVERRRVP